MNPLKNRTNGAIYVHGHVCGYFNMLTNTFGLHLSLSLRL